MITITTVVMIGFQYHSRSGQDRINENNYANATGSRLSVSQRCPGTARTHPSSPHPWQRTRICKQNTQHPTLLADPPLPVVAAIRTDSNDGIILPECTNTPENKIYFTPVRIYFFSSLSTWCPREFQS